METTADRTPVYCADCGLQILDIQDTDYTVDAVGNVLTVSHTAEFHREVDGSHTGDCDDAGCGACYEATV